MNGFNVMPQQQRNNAPFQMLSPEVLAQLAAASFKPPQAPQMGGMQMPQQGQDGMGMQQGMGMLGHGIDFLTGQQYRGGNPAASAAYGSARPAIPADVIARGGWIGGGV